MSLPEPNIKELRKQLFTKIKTSEPWDFYDITVKVALLSGVISFFYVIGLMNNETLIMKLFLALVPIALAFGIWALFLAIEVVGKVVQDLISETWIWVVLTYGVILIFGW